MSKHYYQTVRKYGKHDFEYVIHEARKDRFNNIEISAIPIVLIGNTIQEIKDTLKLIEKHMKNYPPIDKADCNIFHDNLIYEDDFPEEDEQEDELDEHELYHQYGIDTAYDEV